MARTKIDNTTVELENFSNKNILEIVTEIFRHLKEQQLAYCSQVSKQFLNLNWKKTILRKLLIKEAKILSTKFKFDYQKTRVQVELAKIQAATGDATGAKKTVLMLKNIKEKGLALIKIAKKQIANRTIIDAKKTITEANIAINQMDYSDKCRLLPVISKMQIACRDIAGAKETVKHIEDSYKAIQMEYHYIKALLLTDIARP